ncbi:MAG: LLM class flavin-dependent oxidoreductase [Acidimicrobiaceae bacterium]|nr:LLM class flavin-dependent oxidoreductase [Acidimicrobiaceae bacterium]MXZ64114.1 LLM class flavin-dependent oxidoreductase [Acidimicrobiaceae bacterium]MYF31824.1 LLM class flavin-dependent oxidoreductase [Acidimicrobiaceae bacterium]MYG77106.1 LLM class flavin-dependent oxidoreductase [Acidimicrobiaceae bacterium]MYJ30538.1 LLM class flavin-dependent oxidoreductase [Acidimicrobiaceae bacterium]
MVGVINHVANPDAGQAVALAQAAEEAGAQWIGVADAFWWRDVWMLLGRVAAATERIKLGPAMTNPYLRHRFHTASALATLQEMAPGRVFCGIAAGGSEVTAAARISRRDAPAMVTELVAFLREVAGGGTLDEASGRGLDVDLDAVPILMAGRGDQMMRAAGALADRVLLWAIPASDLRRSVSVIRDGAAHRDRPPELIWAPLVRHDDAPHASIMHVAVYASLNTAADVRQEWGLDGSLVEDIREQLVRGDTAAAADLVPPTALGDLIFESPDPAPIAAIARELGVSSLAVPGFDPATVGGHVSWAASVETLFT